MAFDAQSPKVQTKKSGKSLSSANKIGKLGYQKIVPIQNSHKSPPTVTK